MAQRPDWREFVALISRPCALALDTRVHLEPYHAPGSETVRHSEAPPLPLHLPAHLSGQWERQHLSAGAPSPASAFLPERLDELANALRAYRDGVFTSFAPTYSSTQNVRLRETPPVLWDKMRAFRFKEEPTRPLDEVCRITSSLRIAVEQAESLEQIKKLTSSVKETLAAHVDSERELRELDASYAQFSDLLDRVRVDGVQTKLSVACASLRAAVVACMTQPRLWHVLNSMSVRGQRNGQQQAVQLARNAVSAVDGRSSEGFKVKTLALIQNDLVALLQQASLRLDTAQALTHHGASTAGSAQFAPVARGRQALPLYLVNRIHK